MRYSHAFSATLREAPSEVTLPSQQMLLRAGYIQPIHANRFAFLPLAQRTIAQIEAILREGLNALGSQELHLVTSPADNAEEIISHLSQQIVQSYRQLPQGIHHFHVTLAGERGSGLFSPSEVTALSCYTLDSDQTGLESQAQATTTFQKAFRRCGLSMSLVRSDHDETTFVYLTNNGPDRILCCDTCNYAAEPSVAKSLKAESSAESLLPVEKVATPEMTSIASLAGYLNIPTSKTAKAVFYTVILEGIQGSQIEVSGVQEPLLVFAMLRGDRILSEPKLKQALGKAGKGRLILLQPALESDIKAAGAVPGYASPIGIRQGKALVVVDQELLTAPNLVAGANETGYHLRNTNVGRDYEPDIIADIAQVEPGAPCPDCPGQLALHQGVMLGRLGKLNAHINVANPTFLDEHGVAQPIQLGCISVWIEPLLASVAEAHHDTAGLIWLVTVAPYPIHLVALSSKDGSAEAAAETLYQDLVAAGLEPLYDDRDERAGVKFNDADLIGLPLRITVSSRSLENGGYEFKRRDGGERWIVPVDDCIPSAQHALNNLGFLHLR